MRGVFNMEYLIRFAQVHETFRLPELQAVATLAGVDYEIIRYGKYVCQPCFVHLQFLQYFDKFVAGGVFFPHYPPYPLLTQWPVTILRRKTAK